MPAQTPAELVQEFVGEFSAFKTANATALEEIAAAANENTAAALKTATDALEKVTAVVANMEEIEQKVSEGIHAGNQFAPKTVGEMIVASEEYKALKLTPGETPAAGVRLRVQANTLTGQDGDDSDHTLVGEQRKPGIVPGAFRALRIADMLTVVPTSSNSYQFTRELLFTNAAAETAEGAAKPETTLTFVSDDVAIRTIAHWIKASNQILADAPALRSYIDNRMIYGCDLKEENSIIGGDGLGQNISGMTAAGNFTEFTPTVDETSLDGINRCKQAILVADYVPDALMLNPADWGNIERLKTTQETYLVGNPFGQITPILWGLPVVLSNAVPLGYLHMADYATSFDLARRQNTVVDVGYDSDDFTKNLMTIRAEKRSALATLRPASAYYGELATVTP